MNIFTIIIIALGLAMDSLAVSITSGLTLKKIRLRNALKIAIFFSLFQATMPIIGWLAGVNLGNFVSEIDHWIAFGLLTFIGSRIIYNSIYKKSSSQIINPLKNSSLILLSIATSIDALIVGATFAFLNISILTAVIVIGVITFLLSFSGVYIGTTFGHFSKKKIEILGGIILIGIGIKILLEHLL